MRPDLSNPFVPALWDRVVDPCATTLMLFVAFVVSSGIAEGIFLLTR